MARIIGVNDPLGNLKKKLDFIRTHKTHLKPRNKRQTMSELLRWMVDTEYYRLKAQTNDSDKTQSA